MNLPSFQCFYLVYRGYRMIFCFFLRLFNDFHPLCWLWIRTTTMWSCSTLTYYCSTWQSQNKRTQANFGATSWIVRTKCCEREWPTQRSMLSLGRIQRKAQQLPSCLVTQPWIKSVLRYAWCWSTYPILSLYKTTQYTTGCLSTRWPCYFRYRTVMQTTFLATASSQMTAGLCKNDKEKTQQLKRHHQTWSQTVHIQTN
jgi:hypothetical protein